MLVDLRTRFGEGSFLTRVRVGHTIMPPQISIIVPFHNPGRHFLPAIQSVFAQTFSDWELLLMDDGSTDGSLALARTIDDDRVRVFSDGHCLRITARLNQLIDLAHAPYIARMDADDVIHPDRLATQYALLRQFDSNTVVGTGTYSMDGNSKISGIRLVSNTQRYGFAARHSFVHASIMASADWFRRYRYSQNSIFSRAEDSELWLRSSPNSRFINIQRALYFYRERGDFSLEKYIGSALSLIVLALRLAPESRPRAAYEVTRIFLKTWMVIMASLLGFVEAIVARRSRALRSEEMAEALSALARVDETFVPLREPAALAAEPLKHHSAGTPLTA